MIVEPVIVRVRNRCSSTIRPNAATMISRRCIGAVRPRNSTIWPYGVGMRWKSAPHSACAPASRNSRMPMAAIMSWISGALRRG
ncbi:hypothetical protein D3C71_1967710 [compost metagenome]